MTTFGELEAQWRDQQSGARDHQYEEEIIESEEEDATETECETQYLTPGTFLTPEWLPGVTVFVLGPPRSEEKIKNLGEHGSPELYELSGNSVSAFRSVTQLFAYRGERQQLGIQDYFDVLAEGKRADDLDELKVNLPFDRRYRIDVKGRDPRRSLVLFRPRA